MFNGSFRGVYRLFKGSKGSVDVPEGVPIPLQTQSEVGVPYRSPPTTASL